MSCVVIDVGTGNYRSVENGFRRMAAERGYAGAIARTADPEVIRGADRLVLPGVGAFGACAAGLFAAPGVAEAMRDAVFARGRPLLGVCVGMQLLSDRGLEFGAHEGLGWIPGDVRPITPSGPEFKIPHMGWNVLRPRVPHPLFDGLAEGAHAYFVHSFTFHATQPEHVAATVDHGGEITAAVIRDTVAGVQFHPEKSQASGLRLIGNFLEWKP